jgi:hypothetical protein
MAPALAGLPLLVEHIQGARAGTVTFGQCNEEGHVLIDLEVDERVCAFVERGVLAQLALSHLQFEDGRLEPVEVSLVREALRPNTRVFTEVPTTPRKLHWRSSRTT